MKQERDRHWPETLAAALRALAAGTAGAGVLAELLHRLAQDLQAEGCALLALRGDGADCLAASPSAEAALAGLDAAQIRNGAAGPAIVRRGPGQLAMVLRPGPGRAPAAPALRRLDDVLALAGLAMGAAAPDAPPEAADDGLRRLAQGQALSLDLIDQLLAVPIEGLDAAIDAGLARLGAHVGSDRLYIFQITGPGLMSNTHEWCADTIAPMRAALQDLPTALADLWWPALESDGQVHVPDVHTLASGDPIRSILDAQGIRALLVVPLRQEGRVTGFMGYDSVQQARHFCTAEINLLRGLANIVATLLARRQIADEAAQAQRRHDHERQRLRATMRALPDTVMELDGQRRIAAVHAPIGQPLAISPVSGQSLDTACPAPVAALAHEVCGELDRGGTVMDRRLSLQVDGRQRWFSVSAARREADGSGGAAGYVLVLRDVTERQTQRVEIERLVQIVRNTTNLVVTTDAAGRIDWVNPAFEARTGYGLAEARGRKPGTLLQGPETDPATVARIREAIAEGRSITTEIQNRTRAGTAYWVELNIQPIKDPEGRLLGFMSIQSDTTEHREHARQLERALAAEKSARDRLQSAVDTMQEGLVLFDAEQRLVLCNGVFRRIFPALSPQLKPGVAYRAVLEAGIASGDFARQSTDHAAWLGNQICAFATGSTITGTVARGGRWYRHTQMPTPDGGRIALFSDVTELKDAELRALAERARALDASHDGIAQVSAQGAIRYANAAAARILGFPGPEALVGRDWRELVRSPGAPPAAQPMPPAGWQGALELARADGTIADVELSATPDDDGGALCILRDITERRRAEAERERLGEELALARRRADLSLVAMGLSHDLNNLLSAISGAASLIEADGTPMARAMAGNIATAVDQAARLVKRLMALGRPANDKGPADLRGPLQDTATLVRASLRAPLRLELTLPAGPMVASIDPTGVMQMALNLCINARDALLQAPNPPDRGCIGLSLARAAPEDAARAFEIGALDPATPYARITVEDNGPGMDAATRSKVFTAYFSTKGDRGTGLGVPIAAEVVKDHRGALALETGPGQGARFTIFLPLAEG